MTFAGGGGLFRPTVGTLETQRNRGKNVAVEDNPLFQAWDKALGRLIEAERRYHVAKIERRPEDEIQQAARDLDDAREEYRAASDAIESFDAEAKPSAIEPEPQDMDAASHE
jgi:hypothetical protein